MQGEEGGSLVQGVFRGAGVGSGVKRPSPWGRAAPNDVPTAGTLPGWGTGVRCGDLAVHAQHFGVQIPTNFCTPFFCSPTSTPVTQLLRGGLRELGPAQALQQFLTYFFLGGGSRGKAPSPHYCPPRHPPTAHSTAALAGKAVPSLPSHLTTRSAPRPQRANLALGFQ